MSKNPFVGNWTYRSLLNDPNTATAFNDLEFGLGVLSITETGPDTLGGSIGMTTGPASGQWGPLQLHGAMTPGNPRQVRFQGKGLVGGELWIYDYIAWLVPVWPNSTALLQTAALVGSVVRTIPHSGGKDQPVHPAGVVASFYCVKQS